MAARRTAPPSPVGMGAHSATCIGQYASFEGKIVPRDFPHSWGIHLTDGVRAFTRRVAVFFFSCSLSLVGQNNSGELRFRVTDPSGLAVKTSIQIVSEANQYRRVLGTDDQGALTLQRLPFGVYQIQIRQPGFAEISQSINLHSSIPTDYAIELKLNGARESVAVTAANTLIDPDQAGSVNQIGSDSIQNRVSSIPGRSIRTL